MAAKGLSHFFQKDKTFRPKRKLEEGTLRYELHKQSKASLHSGINLKECVKLPADEDLNDWVAVHIVDFFNRINLIYGAIAEVCTEESCPTMSGGKRYEYHWCDGDRYKKPNVSSSTRVYFVVDGLGREHD
ncbi:MOB-like protein phocein [Desmophyllum pertusum]|uniref:MOB-like protein phocein n=1 Tax=Desmophyllum pertusum TaxID=174260 RepID=A0A9W9YLU8_9CNID|nr:MOB-like protein phocein [Desmophyllum pertusum]